MMDKEEHIRHANTQLIEQGDLDVVDSAFTAGYIAHAEDKEYKGHEFIKRFARQLRSAIPDIRILNIEFLVEAGNTIAWQRTLRGAHKADMMGIPPSGQVIIWHEMVASRFEGGKIAEEWVVSNLAGQLLLKQPIKK